MKQYGLSPTFRDWFLFFCRHPELAMLVVNSVVPVSIDYILVVYDIPVYPVLARPIR
jgi:hypothetical protein